MKYRVEFSGFAYVKADSAEEAKEKYFCDDFIFHEHYIDDVTEADDCLIEVL